MRSYDPGNLGLGKDKLSGSQCLVAFNGLLQGVPNWSSFLPVFMRMGLGLFLSIEICPATHR